MVRLLPFLILVPGLAFAQGFGGMNGFDHGGEGGLELGPPAPLAGVPIDFRCDGAPEHDHRLYRRYPGRDLHNLIQQDPSVVLPEAHKPRDPVDLRTLEPWLDRTLCGLIWDQLAAAGAHAAPTDVALPARAVLDIRLTDVFIEGSREVEQRVGSTVMPISVPHWALSTAWTARFSIEYRGAEDSVTAAPLDIVPRGGAEQDDYTPLRLGELLNAATLAAFDGLPGLLADEGRIGDLLFSVVDRPSEAPPALDVTGTLSESFWTLLSPSARARHDALAFYLSSDKVNDQARREMARWFLLHDSDLGLRRDALAWLLGLEAAPEDDLSLSDKMVELLVWLIARDPSARIRTEVLHALKDRTGPEVRELLLVASGDTDPRVVGIALELLSTFPPATAAEMDAITLIPEPPRLAPWTVAFDGRLPPPPGSLHQHLLTLATASGGSAAETFAIKWLRSTAVADEELDWVPDAWLRLSASPSVHIREEAIGRLSREEGRGGADEILSTRIATETTWALRLLAIEGLFDPTAASAGDALIQATHDDTPQVRTAATLRLGEVTGPDALHRLEVLVRNDPDARVRRTARKALRMHQLAGR